MQIAWHREPQTALRRMQPAKAADIVGTVERIASDPSAPNNNIGPLHGVRNGFRVRVGDWRVSYTLDRTAGLLTVFEVAPRGGAYR